MEKYTRNIVTLCVLAVSFFYINAAVGETLTVPYRGAAAMQTAATTIEFEPVSFGANPGVTVDTVGSVGHEVDIPVPSAACVPPNCSEVALSDGNIINVTRIPGSNRVQLTLTYIPSFEQDGGIYNYCSYIGAATDKNFEVTLTDFSFSGANPEYRISSFMAPSDASCDIPYVRVPTARPSFPPAPWIKEGRLALNLVLVLDKSGSMTLPIPGSTDIRWDRMKESVNLFASVWDAVGAPPAPATESSEGHPNDNLGIVFFSTTSVERNLDGGSFFKERGALAAPWAADVAAILNAEPVDGWTSIGSGIVNAKTRLNDVDAVLGDSAIVLFTDGEQNRAPCVVHEGETISPVGSDHCSVAVALPDSNLLEISGDVLAQDLVPRGPVFTVGLGEGGMADSALLLDEISQETAGRVWFPNNGVAMDISFVDSLVQYLRGGTVSLMGRSNATIPIQTESGPLTTVNVDESITRVVFVLSWNGRGHREVELNIQHPTTTDIAPDLEASGTNFLVRGFNLSATDAGDWIAQVSRYSDRGGEMEYQLSAYAVESQFSSSVIESSKLGTGQPINIVAEVGWGSDVLDALPANAIQAFIEKPGENFGNILFETELPADMEIGEDSSALAEKINHLAEEGSLLERIEPKAGPNAIALSDAGDGRYEGTLASTSVDVGGNYRIRIEFNWDDPRTGAIKRVQYAERPVAVRPTAEASELTGILNDDKNLLTLLLIPRDGFGNYVGPGFGSQIKILVNGAQINPSISDLDQKGIYSISDPQLTLAVDPQIQISYGDIVMADGTLSSLTNGNGSGVCQWYDFTCGQLWLKYLLLIIILLLILFLLFRRSSSNP